MGYEYDDVKYVSTADMMLRKYMSRGHECDDITGTSTEETSVMTSHKYPQEI